MSRTLAIARLLPRHHSTNLNFALLQFNFALSRIAPAWRIEIGRDAQTVIKVCKLPKIKKLNSD
jgi:hypothetical protein